MGRDRVRSLLRVGRAAGAAQPAGPIPVPARRRVECRGQPGAARASDEAAGRGRRRDVQIFRGHSRLPRGRSRPHGEEDCRRARRVRLVRRGERGAEVAGQLERLPLRRRAARSEQHGAILRGRGRARPTRGARRGERAVRRAVRLLSGVARCRAKPNPRVRATAASLLCRRPPRHATHRALLHHRAAS